MIRWRPWASLPAAATLVLLVSACSTAKTDTGDSTPPDAQILFQKPNNEYVSSSTAMLGMDGLDLIGKVIDKDGVRSVRVEFLNTKATSCTVSGTSGSTIYEGVFYLSLPGPFEISPTPTASDEAFTETGIPVHIARPACTANGQLGIPSGHVIEVRCTGKNWSSNAQQSTTVVTAKLTVVKGAYSSV